MVNEISLKNFKTFDDDTFKIAPLTLVLGLNAMGKSSLIQSLLLLKQNYENGNLDREDKMMRLEGDYVSLEDAGSLCYQWAEDRTVEIGITMDNGDVQRWKMDARDDTGIDLPAVTGEDKTSVRNLFGTGFTFIGADRLTPEKYYSKISKRTYKSSLGINGELTPAYLYRALNKNEDIAIPGMKADKAADLQLTNNVSAWMSDIMGMEMTAMALNVDIQTVKLQYTIGHSPFGEPFSPLQVGFGFTYTLPIVTALLIAGPDHLVLIENPEAHLHPAAQVKLGELLGRAAANGMQVIVETHSDHIINGVRLARKNGVLTRDDQVNMIFIERITDEHDIPYSAHTDVRIAENGKFSEPLPDCFNTWTDTLVKLI